MTWSQEAAGRIARGESTYRQEAEEMMRRTVEALPRMTPEQAKRASVLVVRLMRVVQDIDMLSSLGEMFKTIEGDTLARIEEGTWTSTDGSGPSPS